MSVLVLGLALTIAETMLGLAMVFAGYRLLRGPRAQDRAGAIDALSTSAMLLLVMYGVQTGSTLYFEAALILSLLAFTSTAALAKFLMRGEVIE